jgi:cobalt-zinc-cadmium efflux system protein
MEQLESTRWFVGRDFESVVTRVSARTPATFSMTRSQRLGFALVLNLVLVVGQIVFGLAANSLGLLADAGHNLTDAAAVMIALIAVRLSRRPPTPTRSYGYHRATILAAFVNAAAILIVAGIITFEAITRLSQPESVNGGIVLVVALGAALLNAGAALILYERRVDLNMRAALLHMSADAAASLGVAAVGLVILLTGGFEWLDPVVSIAISVLIAIEAWRLLRATIDILLESTPRDVDLSALRAAVTELDDVVDIHDLHVWSLSSGIRALSAHVVVSGQPTLEQAETVATRVKDILGPQFAIAHATLEVESIAGAAACVSDIERHVPD